MENYQLVNMSKQQQQVWSNKYIWIDLQILQGLNCRWGNF